MKSKYVYIGELVEEGVPLENVIDEALSALDIGEYVSEYISELIHIAMEHDLQAKEMPLAILKDALHEVKKHI